VRLEAADATRQCGYQAAVVLGHAQPTIDPCVVGANDGEVNPDQLELFLRRD
jgi:hypothetical protein